MNRIVAGLRWWRARCGVPWAIFISIVTGVGVIWGGVYAAAPVIAEWRFWSMRWETSLIADKVYPRALEEQRLRIIIIDDRIKWLEALGGKMNSVQFAELQDLRRQRLRAKDEEEQLIRERAIFQLQMEFR